MKVLVIAPHPDDETVGAGGTIARHVAHGDEVYWCIVAQMHTPAWPEATVTTARQQIGVVQEVLGIQEVFLCGFPTLKLNTIPTIDLCTALQRVVDQVRPEVVYTSPIGDTNQDHCIVHRCTLVATRALLGCPVRRILSYEVSSSYQFSGGFAPNVFVDITDYLEVKLTAMYCYKTELRPWPHLRSIAGLRLRAEERGARVGMQAAERFQLIRELIV